MRFIPHTQADIASMLQTVGKADLEEIVAQVPADLRRRARLDLPDGMCEADVVAEVRRLAARNTSANGLVSFLGGGCYRHYVPAAVRAVVSRAEFATAYTPYQAEASQGTTQAIFEFQTLIADLTGMDVANASMYDGASAAAEAVLMARRMRPRRSVVILSRALWPDYRGTIRTYLSALDDVEIVEADFDRATGATVIEDIERRLDDRLLCTVTGYPNGFGIIEPLGRIVAATHRAGGVAISVTAEAVALGLLKPPGVFGVDVAVGEGRSLGTPMQFGGPGFGFMASRTADVRRMPGRLVGQTRDQDGRRAFCLTLATREQHIRRERATSNICTNNSLSALAATVFLCLMGRRGMRDLAERNVEIAHEALAELSSAGIEPRFTGAFFNEFMIRVRDPLAALAAGERNGVLAGLAIGSDYPELPDVLLVAVTEMNRRADLRRLVEALSEGR